MKRLLKRTLKCAIRIYEYSNIGGHWIGWIESIFTVVLAIRESIPLAFVFLIGIRGIRAVVGYLDLNFLGMTAYSNEWISQHAPMQVKVMKDGKKKLSSGRR